jgi:hypothetical protein
VFVPLVIASFDNLACMGLVLFLRSISEETNIIMDIEIEQGSGLAPCFVDYKVIKSVVLRGTGYQCDYASDECNANSHGV